MKKIILLVFALLTLPAHAETRVPDRSLSVVDTFREPIIRYNLQSNVGDSGFAPNAPIDPNMAKELQDLKAQEKIQDGKNNLPFGEIPAFPNHGETTKSYMSKFCTNASENNGGQTCQETKKQQACDRFRSAAVNVQQVLDRAISCEVNTANAIESDCDGLDAGRLDLLKQYWQDEDMSYTILFLPDMVLNTATNCSTKHGVTK